MKRRSDEIAKAERTAIKIMIIILGVFYIWLLQ